VDLRRRSRRAAPASRRATGAAVDGGFTVVEVIVAIAVICIVMTALTTFFVTAVSAMGQQGGRQTAVQLADDSTERIRALEGSAVAMGRDKTSADLQWASPVAGVEPYLADMQETWDPAAGYPSGASAPLPTSPISVTLNGLSYQQHWYVGKCWQPVAGGDCGASQQAGYIEFFRVVVTVTWRDRRCASSTCAYLAATLVSNAIGDPVFDTNQNAQPPTVNDPSSQVQALGQVEVSVPVSLQLTASGGAPPMTWSASGLPPGLLITSSGGIAGAPTAAGSYSVTVNVSDGFSLVGTATFQWTIKALPQLTSPGNQTSPSGTAVSLSIPVTGGVAPFTWSVTTPGPWGATGLPPGLSIDPSTGVISGTPTATGLAKDVTVTVTDSAGKSGSTTFSWAVQGLLQAQTPAAQTGTVNVNVTPLQLVATGGTAPYTWAATGLPTGLTISSTGLISGKPTEGTRYVVAVTVTDSTGSTRTVGFVWTVAQGGNSVYVTAPTGDRTGNLVGQNVAFTAAASGGGGSGSFTWTATGLPPGMAISSGDTVSGTLTQSGTYTVRLTAHSSNNKVATFMFTWTVQ